MFSAPYKILDNSLRLTPSQIKITGVPMAIYRTLYYADVSVGVGGRVTIPQDMRDDMGIDKGDALTVRVEENPRGGRQMVIWRTEQQPGDEDRVSRCLIGLRPIQPRLLRARVRHEATTLAGNSCHRRARPVTPRRDQTKRRGH